MAAMTSATSISRPDAAIGPTLLGAVVRSTIPRGRIKRVELDPRHDWSRVVVVTAQDIPGRAAVTSSPLAFDVLANREVHYVGEPVLLLAAETEVELEAAVAAVVIEYQGWMPVSDLEESIEAKTRIRGPSNVIHDEVVGVELAATDDEDDDVVESLFVMESREQPIGRALGARATWDDDGSLVVAIATGRRDAVRDSVAATLDLVADSIVIESAAGSMFAPCPVRECELACQVALLAHAARRPVVIVGRDDDRQSATAARLAGEASLRTILGPDGVIESLAYDLVLDGGAYAPDADTLMREAIERVATTYPVGPAFARARVMATNTTPRALGGAGAPQSTLALERHVDRIARRLGFSAVAYRLRLLAERDDGDLACRVLRRAVDETDYERKRAGPRTCGRTRRCGIGVAFAARRAAFPSAAFCCAVAEVEVDIVTFEVGVIALHVHRDRASTAVDRAVSVIERAAARTLGFGAERENATFDEWAPDALVRGMPTAADFPRIELRFEEEGVEADDHDHEFAADPVEPALVAAVENALGIDLEFVPLTPESLVQADELSRRASRS